MGNQEKRTAIGLMKILVVGAVLCADDKTRRPENCDVDPTPLLMEALQAHAPTLVVWSEEVGK